MIDEKAKKARGRIAALRKLSRFLNTENMQLMYTAFIRPILEYGRLLYCSASKTHLRKLDRVQAAAELLGKFQVESLAARRDGAILNYSLKLLSDKVHPLLKRFRPTFTMVKGSRTRARGYRVSRVTSSKSLIKYDRSFFGRLPLIWSRVPQKIIEEGISTDWRHILSRKKQIYSSCISD